MAGSVTAISASPPHPACALPNTGNGADFDCTRQYTNYPQIGVYNTSPAWLADGRIVFTSSRNNFLPPQSFNSGQPTLQLLVMDSSRRACRRR